MSPDATHTFARGQADARMKRRRLLIIFGGVFGVIVVLAVIGALVGESKPAKPACKSIEPCGAPPKPAAPLVNNALYRSGKLGYQVEYASDKWSKSSDTDDSQLVLSLKGVDASMVIAGVPASEGSPARVLASRRNSLSHRLFAFADDTDSRHQVLGPELAFHDGVAGAYVGEVDTPQGVRAPLSVIVLAAGDTNTTLTATVVMSQSEEHNRGYVMGNADSVLNTLRLRGEVVS